MHPARNVQRLRELRASRRSSHPSTVRDREEPRPRPAHRPPARTPVGVIPDCLTCIDCVCMLAVPHTIPPACAGPEARFWLSRTRRAKPTPPRSTHFGSIGCIDPHVARAAVIDNKNGELLAGCLFRVSFQAALSRGLGGPSFKRPATVLLFRGDGLHVGTVTRTAKWWFLKTVEVGRDYGSTSRSFHGLNAEYNAPVPARFADGRRPKKRTRPRGNSGESRPSRAVVKRNATFGRRFVARVRGASLLVHLYSGSLLAAAPNRRFAQGMEAGRR